MIVRSTLVASMSWALPKAVPADNQGGCCSSGTGWQSALGGVLSQPSEAACGVSQVCREVLPGPCRLLHRTVLQSQFCFYFKFPPQGCRRILKNVTRVKTNTVMAPWICKSCGILAQRPWKCSFPFSQSCGFCNLLGVEYLTLQIQHCSPRICNSDTGGRLSFLFLSLSCLEACFQQLLRRRSSVDYVLLMCSMALHSLQVFSKLEQITTKHSN